jgi:hypothetical protein
MRQCVFARRLSENAPSRSVQTGYEQIVRKERKLTAISL